MYKPYTFSLVDMANIFFPEQKKRYRLRNCSKFKSLLTVSRYFEDGHSYKQRVCILNLRKTWPGALTK